MEVDICCNDSENDADGDGLCGDIDICPYDLENDADNDGICGDIDACPYDAENDIDEDGLCCADIELYFDGINDYVEIANSNSLNITEEITISAKIKPNTSTSDAPDLNSDVIVLGKFNGTGLKYLGS